MKPRPYSAPRLELHRETLHRLDARHLAEVHAGLPPQAPTQDSACCTLPRTGTC